MLTGCGLLAIACLAANDSSAAAPEDAPSGDWTVVGHDPQGTRFSPLEQITAANVASLKLAFSFPTGIDKGHEAAPLRIRQAA